MTSIRVVAPAGVDARRAAYVVDVVFRDWLGIPVQLLPGHSDSWRVTDESGGKVLLMSSAPGFLEGRRRDVPLARLASWDAGYDLPEARLTAASLPVIAGTSSGSRYVEEFGRAVRLGLDVLGSTFFMLARSEELEGPLDDHDRFPAAASLAARHDFLLRPIVDEYVEILRAAMNRLWPGIAVEPAPGRTWLTSDVDVPYDLAACSPRRMMRAAAADLVRRRSPAAALRRLMNWRRIRRGDFSADPNNTFGWLLDRGEENGHRITFFFVAEHSHPRFDGCYSLDEPFIRGLMDMALDRGHEIGLHGSYDSYRDEHRTARERSRLEAVLADLGRPRAVDGNRQHYLRWDSGTTPGILARAGLRYDASGGYADHVGFRYGTARSFPMWDWPAGGPAEIRQRPLIVMDTTLFGPHYMGLTEAAEISSLGATLRERATRYGGDFALLWHSNNLFTPFQRDLFRAFVSW